MVNPIRRESRFEGDRVEALDLRDLDDVELLRDVEEAFEIAIAHEKAVACETLGDLYAIVLRKLPATEPTRCATAVAYHRLKRAIESERPDLGIRPETRVSNVLSGSGIRRGWRALEDATDLRLPPLAWNAAVGCVATFLFFSPVLWLLFPGAAFAPFTPLLTVGSILLLRYGPRHVPASCETLGELARAVTALNHGALSRLCGGSRPDAVWDALEYLVRDVTGQTGALTRETRLGPPRKRRKRKGTTLYAV